jgi:hypothetical protein
VFDSNLNIELKKTIISKILNDNQINSCCGEEKFIAHSGSYIIKSALGQKLYAHSMCDIYIYEKDLDKYMLDLKNTPCTCIEVVAMKEYRFNGVSTLHVIKDNEITYECNVIYYKDKKLHFDYHALKNMIDDNAKQW